MSIVRTKTCELCGNEVHTYSRKFNAGMAKTMLSMLSYLNSAKPHDGWMNVNHIPGPPGFVPSQSREISLVKLWGLVEEKPNENTGKRTSGIWRMTDVGLTFVNDTMEIPSNVIETQRVFEGFEGDLVKIHQCEGDNFNYPELIAWARR
jgi:hypothetical protein